MSLTLASVENELKSRLRILGAFAAAESSNRLRYAIKGGLLEIWNRHNWDFKNSTADLATSQGNLGPYTAPSGMVRFAATQKLALFGLRDAVTLAPISPTDAQEWKPYLMVQDGGIYFFEDPGSQTLTLNYLGEFVDSIEDAELGTLVALYPSGLKNAIMTLASADLLRDLPGRAVECDMTEKRGLQYVDDYFEISTLGTVQTQIAPKGLRGQRIDNYAQTITVLGPQAARFHSEL